MLEAYRAEIDGLQAEEALRQSEIIAMGMGQLPKSDRNKVMGRWRAAMGAPGQKVLRGNRAGLAMLASMGIKVKEDGSR